MSGRRVDAKVVLLGQEGVGKSSLVERCAHRRFRPGPYQNDTAGSERYEAMSRIYYRGARAAVVCYDLTDSSSFQRAKFWVNELQNCEEGCRIYLCGTKSDLLEEDRRKRAVDFHDVQDYADEIKAELFETSSKTGQSVDELFQKVAEDYVQFTTFQVMTAVWACLQRGSSVQPRGLLPSWRAERQRAAVWCRERPAALGTVGHHTWGPWGPSPCHPVFVGAASPNHCCGPAVAVNLFSWRCCPILCRFIEASSLEVYNVNKTHCGLSCPPPAPLPRLSHPCPGCLGTGGLPPCPPAPQDKAQEDIESKVKLYFTVIFLLYTKNYSTCSGSTCAGQPSFHYKFHIHSQQSKGSKTKVINGPRLSPLPLLKIIYMLEICRFLSPALASLLRTDRQVPGRTRQPHVPNAVLAPVTTVAPTHSSVQPLSPLHTPTPTVLPSRLPSSRACGMGPSGGGVPSAATPQADLEEGGTQCGTADTNVSPISEQASRSWHQHNPSCCHGWPPVSLLPIAGQPGRGSRQQPGPPSLGPPA
ncbi:ras-related protein Rab-24 isoform X2 [Phalacrocorax aristotelis]|uniref:ras-related protein Rab-24 isoform X2 n=1 Tax=Phalacrocorax aristotelis TaxID=126867 RepID=UPI003F4AF825